LCEALEKYLELYTSDENGFNKAKSLQQVLDSQPEDSKAYLSAYEELNSIGEIPACVEHIWQYFWELHNRRWAGMNGPLPLSFTEISSWIRLTGKIVRKYEIDIILQLDSAYMNFSHQEARKKRQQKKGKK
jgi:hypothetical protein